MARRYDHSPQELRQMILTAAGEMVGEAGIRGVSARKVAARIGYSVGTLYNVFENFDDIIVHLNGETLDALHDVLANAASDQDVVAALTNLTDAYIEFTSQNRHRWNLLFEHHLPPGKVLPEWYNQKVAGLLAFVEAAIAPLFDVTQEPERARAARALWASLHGIVSLSTSDKLDVVAVHSTKDLSTFLIENVVRGLQTNLK